MPMLLLRSVVLLLAGAVGVLSTTATAQAGAQDLPTCIGCHGPKDTVIDPERFGASVHGSLDCSICHAEGFAEFPHRGQRAAAPDCSDCHADTSPSFDFAQMAKGVKESVHVKMADPAFRCTNCHSPHYFVPATRMTDAAEAIRIANRSCLRCHAKGETERETGLSLNRLADKHRWIPNWKLHLQGAPCVACHTPRDQRTVHLILPASQALRDCATCHARNSMLVTKLYSHLASKERAERGWLNAILFNNAYVVGATRNRWLDWGTVALTGLTVLGVAMHATGRWLGARLRRTS